MRRQPGDQVTPIRLPAIDGSTFETDSLRGRLYLLSFLRLAGCPFCNLRIHELGRRFDELGEDFTIVAIFDSSLSNLKRHADRHEVPFQILADEGNRYYREFGVEHSVAGLWKGMIFRMPTLLGAMLRGYPSAVRRDQIVLSDLLIAKNQLTPFEARRPDRQRPPG